MSNHCCRLVWAVWKSHNVVVANGLQELLSQQIIIYQRSSTILKKVIIKEWNLVKSQENHFIRTFSGCWWIWFLRHRNCKAPQVQYWFVPTPVSSPLMNCQHLCHHIRTAAVITAQDNFCLWISLPIFCCFSLSSISLEVILMLMTAKVLTLIIIRVIINSTRWYQEYWW